MNFGKKIVDQLGCIPSQAWLIQNHREEYRQVMARFSSLQNFEMELQGAFPDSFDYVTLKELANDHEKKNFFRQRINKSQVFWFSQR